MSGDGRLARLDRHPAAGVHRLKGTESGCRTAPLVGFDDPQSRTQGATGQSGVLLGDGPGVLEGGGARPLEEGAAVRHLEGDTVQPEGVTGRTGQRADERTHPVAVAHDEAQGLVGGVAHDLSPLPVPAGGDAQPRRASVGLLDPVVEHRLQGGRHPFLGCGEGTRDVGRLALHPRVEDDDVGDGAGRAGAGDFHVVGHARHCRGATTPRVGSSVYLSVAG